MQSYWRAGVRNSNFAPLQTWSSQNLGSNVTSDDSSKAKGTWEIYPRDYPGPKVASDHSLGLQVAQRRHPRSLWIQTPKATILTVHTTRQKTEFWIKFKFLKQARQDDYRLTYPMIDYCFISTAQYIETKKSKTLGQSKETLRDVIHSQLYLYCSWTHGEGFINQYILWISFSHESTWSSF